MHRRLKDYEGIVGEKELQKIRNEASALSEKHLAHVNSTYYGGGVAEILSSIVILMNDLGIRTGWRLLKGSPDFFTVTKKFHDGLQGKKIHLTEQKKKVFMDINEMNHHLCHLEGHDAVMVHDPQPLPLINFYSRKQPWTWKPLPLMVGLDAFPKKQPWIWRCHIDISKPYSPLWNYLKDFITKYDAMIVSAEKFKKKLPMPQHIIPPSIDPLSIKNMEISKSKIKKYLDKFGIPDDKPLIAQISRFDSWKDPMGVIDVYCKVRKKADCNLVLLGNFATDDPEGSKVYQKVLERAKKERGIYAIAFESQILVNSVQRASDVVIQKSLKEGFGLTVSEALWKGTPVVASNVGGIPLQVINGKTGYLVNNIAQCADRVLHLLKNPEKAKEMGQAGKEHVKKNFLVTRHLLDYIRVFKKTLKESNAMRGRVSSVRKNVSSSFLQGLSNLSEIMSEISKG
ncbi:glycosyl transferase family 1 [Candidatus Micrarchaeota archaeon]|nr:MAG: glycosyl transferase family 1 [Candidatus Micrarchaeota archaeon]